MLFSSKAEGNNNAIFLPWGGLRLGDYTTGYGVGLYWSSQYSMDAGFGVTGQTYASILAFTMNDNSKFVDGNNFSDGLLIRPVCED